jgi:hypothetical protein
MGGAPDRGPAARRRLVLVVGLGRSGTSLLAGLLGRLGLQVPQPEADPDESNPRGFAEPRWIVDFHSRLMHERRVAVFDARPAAWEIAAEAAREEEVAATARSWLAVQFVGADGVVLKDPRLGWFLGAWQRAADDLGVATGVVTVLRHPAEIVRSARTWYGEGQTDASRAAAWLNVALHGEHATRGFPRAFVRYDDLLSDWSREISRTAQLLDLPWLVAADRSRYPDADAFVDPALRRSGSGWDGDDVPAALQALAEEAWFGLLALAQPGGDDDAARASLDRSRAAYGELYAEAEAIAQSSIRAARPRRARAEKGVASRGRAERPRAHSSRILRLVRVIPPGLRHRVPLPARRKVFAAHRRVLGAIRHFLGRLLGQ